MKQVASQLPIAAVCYTVTCIMLHIWLKNNITNDLPLINSSLLQYIFNVGHSYEGTPIRVIPGP